MDVPCCEAKIKIHASEVLMTPSFSIKIDETVTRILCGGYPKKSDCSNSNFLEAGAIAV